MKYVLLAYSSILMATVVLGQEFPEEYYQYKEKYPEAHKIVLDLKKDITIDLDKNDNIEIKSKEKEQSLFIHNTAKFATKRSVKFSTFYEVDDIEASTYVYENGRFKRIKVKEFKTRDDLSGPSFHDDLKSMNFIYPRLEEGGKTELIVEESIHNPRFLPKHFFADYSPMVKNSLQIKVHKDISLDFKTFNADDYQIDFRKEQKGRYTIYSWTVRDMDMMERESNAPGILRRIPHIVPYIKSVKKEDGEQILLDKVEGLYGWYYSLISDLNEKAPDEELRLITDSIVKNKTSEIEKVRDIYYWVQQNIKYVAFEDGLGGFKPRQANDVFHKKYGDCKDNSSILLQMFKLAGIRGHLTWIGTREIPYKYSMLPTPDVDNHMILSYFGKDSTYFLDATGRYLPLGLPSSFIQGKEALIAIDSTNYKIETVPVIPPEKNTFHDSVRMEIQEDKLIGSGQVRVGGYQKLNYFHALERIKTDDELKEYYDRNFEKGNNKFSLTSFKERNKFSYDDDFMVDYEFEIQDYITVMDNEIYVNMALDKFITRNKLEKDRKVALETDYKRRYVQTNVLDIPDGYKLAFVPEDLQLKNDKYNVSIDYNTTGQSVVLKTTMDINFLILEVNEFEDYNAFIERIRRHMNESIVLRKINE